MTISTYQIDNVIKAYSKQNKVRLHGDASLPGPVKSGPADSVTIRNKPLEDNIYQKISYSLLDLLKK